MRRGRPSGRSRRSSLPTSGATDPVRVRWVPGADRLLAEQLVELPQKDELCGAFQGLLALRAAGVRSGPDGTALDQEAVALAAGSVLGPEPRAGSLPPGETGRGDFRVALPVSPSAARAGTSARGLARAVQELSGGALAAVPARGAWSAARLGALLDRAIDAPGPLALIANLDAGVLWDPTGPAERLEGYLETGVDQGPDSRWKVGHFAALAGVRRGRGGTLVTVIDSYPSLGHGGVHEQPDERLAAALRRGGRPSRGVIVVVTLDFASAARDWVVEAGLEPELWDNASPDARAAG